VLFLSNTFPFFVKFVHFSDGIETCFSDLIEHLIFYWVTAVLISWFICWWRLMSILCHYIWSWCMIWFTISL
jgi:hypothetical protein